MTMQQLALEEAALNTLARTVAAQLKTVKDKMQDAIAAGGIGQVDATLPDGTKVATISRTMSKATAAVIDPDAFLAWVHASSPHNIVTRLVTEVQPAYATALLAEVAKAGSVEVVDKETGVVTEVAGVEFRPAVSTSHSVRPVENGHALIGEAWRTGALGHLSLPQIAATAPAPDQSADELRARLVRLEERDARLSAMEAAGVDNWPGMELVPALLRADEDGAA